jgi:hypothetical protein
MANISVKQKEFVIAVSISSVSHALFLLRNNLKLAQLNPTYLEWVGFLTILYILPGIVYFLLMPENEFDAISSQGRTATLTTFALYAFVLGIYGLLIGFPLGFALGLTFYGLPK